MRQPVPLSVYCPLPTVNSCGSRPACKPSSVPERVARGTTIHLGRRLPAASSDQPGGGTGRPMAPCLVLLQVRFTAAGRSPGRCWALTPPFHPYREHAAAVCFCGTVLRVSPTGRYPAPCPMELGLSSRATAVAVPPAAVQPVGPTLPYQNGLPSVNVHARTCERGVPQNCEARAWLEKSLVTSHVRISLFWGTPVRTSYPSAKRSIRRAIYLMPRM